MNPIWGIVILVVMITGTQIHHEYRQREIIQNYFSGIASSQNTIGTFFIVQENPKVKGYKKEWYQIKQGECCISYNMRTLLKKGEHIRIENKGVYEVKSFMKSTENTISIYCDMEEIKNKPFATWERVWLERK